MNKPEKLVFLLGIYGLTILALCLIGQALGS